MVTTTTASTNRRGSAAVVVHEQGGTTSSGGGGGGPYIIKPEHIQRRLLSGLGNKGGARGSLTRCAVRLGHVRSALSSKKEGAAASAAAEVDDKKTDDEKPDDEKKVSTKSSSPSSVLDASKMELLRELQLMRIEMTKLVLMVQRQKVELAQDLDDYDEGESSISPSQNKKDDSVAMSSSVSKSGQLLLTRERERVRALRRELGRAVSTQSCRREYESLARLASHKHPTSRRVLQKRMNEHETNLTSAQNELRTTTRHLHVRRGQFQTLIQSMLDLKQSLREPMLDKQEEEGENDDDDEGARKKMDEDDDNDDVDGTENGSGSKKKKSDDGAKPMEVEPSSAATAAASAAGQEEQGGEEEEDLYGDL